MYLSIRDLATSYRELYFNFDGRFSLLSHTNWFGLAKYQRQWFTQPATVTQIARDLRQAKHYNLVHPNDPYYLVEPERYWKEVLIIPPGTVIPEFYLAHKPV